MKKLNLILCIFLQISFIGWVFLDISNALQYFMFPLILIYLIFLPGYLIMKLINFEDISFVHKLLFSVALSLLFIMLIGLCINLILPYLGYERPLNKINLSLSFSIFISIMIILLWEKSYEIENPFLFKKGFLKIPFGITFLIVLFLFTILSSLMVLYYQNNIFLIISLSLLAVSPVIVIQKVDQKYYPIALFLIGFSLLLHTTLAVPFFRGTDIWREYYFTNRVITESFWDSSIDTNLNAMLSLTILAPTFSKILEISPSNVFRLIFPLIYSLVPVGVYEVAKEKFAPKISFLGVCFFIFFFVFYGEMTSLARQQIAELFIILILLIIVTKKPSDIKSSFLAICMGIGLVFSHYGVYYLMMLFLLLLLGLQFLLNKSYDDKNKFLSFRIVIIYLLLGYLWYGIILTSPAETIVNVIYDVLIPTAAAHQAQVEYALGIGFLELSFLRQIKAIIQYGVQFSIILGVGYWLLNDRENNAYKYLSLLVLAVLIFSVISPAFAGALNMTRIYHFTLLILSPFIVVGLFYLVKILGSINIKNIQNKIPTKKILYFGCALLLFFYLMLNTGVAYEITGDDPINTAVGLDRARGHSNEEIRVSVYFGYKTEQDVTGAFWLNEYNENKTILADRTAHLHTLYGPGMLGPFGNKRYLDNETNEVYSDEFLYLDYCNLFEGKIRLEGRRTIELEEIQLSLENNNLVYTNGGCKVYSAN